MAFKDIIGQDGALNMLESALRHNRLAHTLIFTGPDGTGKKMSAVSMAARLNCPAGSEGEQECRTCSSCRQIEAGSHPDVKIISPEGRAGEIRIDAVRELRREIHLKPVKGGYKIFIIDESEKLNEESSNALLKVLEEPPEKSFIILVTSEPAYLLPTIVSRCGKVKFRALSAAETRKALEKADDIPRDKRDLLAKLSEGSPGRALALLQGGLEKREEILEWISREPPPDIHDILKEGEEKTGLNVKDTRKKRDNLVFFFDILLSWYRDVLVCASGGSVVFNEGFAGAVSRQAGTLKVTGALRALGAILEARNMTGVYANPRLVLEAAMIKLAGISGEERPEASGGR